MEINNTGFWIGDATIQHKHDPQLADALAKLFRNSTVYDLGCGEGKYVKHFNDQGDIDALGFDGNPLTDKYTFCMTFDITKSMNLPKNNWVLSLEVGEHIPKELMSQYIDNLKNLSEDGIVLSWAVPGQGGDGHVNELPNEDVIALFPEYDYDIETSLYLRSKATLWWFKSTIMVFKKKHNG